MLLMVLFFFSKPSSSNGAFVFVSVISKLVI